MRKQMPLKRNIHGGLLVLLAAAFMFYKYTLEVSPDVLQQIWRHDFSLNTIQYAGIAATYYYAYMLLQIPMGILTDSWGVRLISTFSALCCAAGALLIALTHSYSAMLIARFIIGFGAAGAFICGIKIITLWFENKHFAWLSGGFIMLGMLGGVGGHAPIVWLLHQVKWRVIFQGLAIAGAVIATLFAIFNKSQGPIRGVTQKESISLKGLRQHLQQVLRQPRSWWLAIYSGLMFAPLIVLGGAFGVVALKNLYQVSSTQANLASEMIFVGFAIGAPLSGWLSDRLRRRLPTLVASPLLTLILLILIGYQHWPTSLLSIGMFLLGLALSGFLPCFAMIKEMNALAATGCAVGFLNTFEALFSGLSDNVVGHVLNQSQTYHVIFACLMVEVAIALIFLSRVPETHCHQE